MKTSEEGIRLNKSFEGYHKRLANGDCCAYQTYLGGGKYDIPTIGYGTVKGIKMGMVMTEAEATERMMQDLAEAEKYVTQFVTVPINANQFDALVLFTNNCGPGNLKKLVQPLNRGDVMGTAKKFPLFIKAQGRTLPGLVSRRAREQALFLKPVEAPTEPYMPQTVEKAPEPVSAARAATVTAGTTITASQLLPLPEVPKNIADSVSNLANWQSMGESAWSFRDFLFSRPVLGIGLIVILAIIWLRPREA